MIIKLNGRQIDDSIILCSMITWLLYYQSKTYVSMHLIHSSSSMQYLGSSSLTQSLTHLHNLSLICINFQLKSGCYKALINQTVIKELIREPLAIRISAAITIIILMARFITLFLLLSLSVFVRVHVLLFKFNWANLKKLCAK